MMPPPASCTSWRGEGKGPPTTCGLHIVPAILIGRASHLWPTTTPCKLTSNPFVGQPLHLPDYDHSTKEVIIATL
ncbi:unnamed protein product [Urochloa humidicola]